MKTFLLTLATLVIAAPAHAQMTHAPMDHSKMDHSKMDHSGIQHGDDHAGHDHAAEADPHAGHAMPGHTMPESALRFADQPELVAALAAGGEPVVAKVLGAVCDFCATAMNKTFGKRDDVAAVYVDLDAKTLNLVLRPGASLNDDALRRAVKRSGYKVDSIARGAAVVPG